MLDRWLAEAEGKAKQQFDLRDLALRGWCFAFLTIELATDAFGAAIFCGYPWAVFPRRIVAHMLGVAAFEIGNPVLFFVLMKADNFSQGHRLAGYCRPNA